MFRLWETRNANAALAFVGVLCLLSLAACTRNSADTREADEKAVSQADAQWEKTVAAKDLDATVAFYTDDAVVLPGDAPVAKTQQAIRAVWAPMVAPNAAVSWHADRTEVARSGDLAYTSGPYQLVTKEASGTTTTERGKFVEIWKKQADGKWKCVLDSFSADAPAAPTGAEINK